MEIPRSTARGRFFPRYGMVCAIVFALSFFTFATGSAFYQYLFLEGGTEAETTPRPREIFGEPFLNSVASSDKHDTLPTRISVPSVGIDFSVVNPTESDIASLDAALLQGVVRHPGSGTPADESPMFLFGHSSHLPVVHNRSFQAFNNLEKVRTGDTISVFSEGVEYRYEARSVTLQNADEAKIMLGGSGKTLTLTTCNNFGEKQERFVVEADFVGVYLRAI